MSSVLEINDLEQLTAYRLRWNALLSRTREANFFQTLDWLQVYWNHFGAGQRLRALVVHSGDEPIGILPLVVRTQKTRVGKIRVLSYPLEDWGTYYGPIGPNPTATLTAGLGYIGRSPRDWDMVDLRWVNRQGCDHRRTPNAMRFAGLHAAESVWSETAVVDVSGDWDDYFADKASRWRRNYRRSERKLAQRGKVEFVRYRPAGSAQGEGDPRWHLFEACQQVAQSSWQQGSTTGTTMSHSSIRDFLHDAHEAAAHAGGLDLNLLLLDGRPVAFAYNYHFQGNVFGLRTGFDASLGTDGAGTVLLGRSLKDSFQRGDRTYDLGPGSLHCKRHWLTSLEKSYRYCHYPVAGARVQAIRAKHWLQQRLSTPGANPLEAKSQGA